MVMTPFNIPNITGITFSKVEPITRCKCGTTPIIGDKFYYKSKYTNYRLEGYIIKISNHDVVSRNGVHYKKDEIEIRPSDIVREEKLKKLGL